MSSLRRHIGVLGQIAGFYLIHFLFFGRHFVDGSAILVGDSQIAISLNNHATYTLNTYHEFLWWDPTGLDGYPALVNLTHGWFNYLSPLILPGHVFVWIATSLLHWPLVTAVQVQLFSLAYLSSLIFVVLLSRELIRSPLARLFPPLVFTLGASRQPVLHACPARHGPGPNIGLPVRAHLFLATSHTLIVVRIYGLSVLLRRVHQLHHVLPSVPNRPVHDSPGCVHSEFSVLRLDRIAGSDGNRPG